MHEEEKLLCHIQVSLSCLSDELKAASSDVPLCTPILQMVPISFSCTSTVCAPVAYFTDLANMFTL